MIYNRKRTSVTLEEKKLYSVCDDFNASKLRLFSYIMKTFSWQCLVCEQKEQEEENNTYLVL